MAQIVFQKLVLEHFCGLKYSFTVEFDFNV